MHLLLRGSPLTELSVIKADGTLMFLIETHPYLEDRRTEVYDAGGDVLGSIIWNGTQPSHICVYSESATYAQAFEMVPRGDPTVSERFEVVAGDGAHEILWVVDRRGLRAHYPMPSRGSSQLPPLIAEFFPKRTEAKASAQVKRKFSEMDCDTMDLDVDGMSDDALGRFWVAFVLLDIIRKSKFRIPDDPTGLLQAQNTSRPQESRGWYPGSAVDTSFTRKGRGWRSRVNTGRLKDLTIGIMLQPRRWSL